MILSLIGRAGSQRAKPKALTHFFAREAEEVNWDELLGGEFIRFACGEVLCNRRHSLFLPSGEGWGHESATCPTNRESQGIENQRM